MIDKHLKRGQQRQSSAVVVIICICHVVIIFLSTETILNMRNAHFTPFGF
jgi:hypothetical protein